MNVKKLAKQIIPRKIVWKREYRIRAKRARMTYSEVEKELDKKFSKVFGQGINWENPKTYNEKLNVAKLYAATEIKTMLTDKIKVVDWVKKQKVGKDLKFIPLLSCYESIDEIDFAKLPKRFVIKMNNDSGSVYVCDEKHPVTEDLKASYRYYFQKRNYIYNSFEMQYKTIQPKIMIEKYMGRDIRDYKFHCFDGKAVHCQVDFDRFSKHTRNFYDKNWQLLPFNNGDYKNYQENVEKPDNYEKMWSMAEKLSKGFDHVRVDFYDIDGEIYFGEMTFTNASGFKPFRPSKKDTELGQIWKLDMNEIRKKRKILISSHKKISE